ncbi:cation:proton antiporter [Chryseobacterium sp. FH2]|uniref:cation:proton antiporter n=1 Tax=Chryseobacterium sp. FH2 TaxID=1674291 RepID=UPI00065D0A49|nr:cation:proton antiporter [Chryseobacterium sp. FH2]KMQ68689.1 cation:proton antiporter [Chryseobacterium sp. FH2]
MNGLLWSICVLCLTTLGIMFLLKKLNQPYLIAYIIVGIVLGPHILGIFTNPEEIEVIGEIGILLLMFFLGMEINVPDKRSLLITPVVAQSIKTLLSIIFAFLVGKIIGLSLNSIILIAVLFVFNSTAVVSEFLKKHNALKTAFGITILNMLIFQDLLLAPVLTLLKAWNKEDFNFIQIIFPIMVCIAIFFVVKRIRTTREIKLPKLFRAIENDHDLQVFFGLFICLGFGLLAETAGLSGALGSFIAGVMVGKVKIFHWLEHSLIPFKVFFVTLFFVSIGLRLDLYYLYSNFRIILLGTFFVLISNSFMSAIVFRLLKYNWRDSWYGGALLSQTGEFGILALSVAYKTEIIEYSLYKAGLGITCLSLLLSTIWIAILKKIIDKNQNTRIGKVLKHKNLG